MFYERLGEQIANELVDWFNQVDATYRSDLRELNELNFARFDAKLEQRLAELWAELNAKMDGLAWQLNGKLDRVVAEHAFAQQDAKIDRGLEQVRTALEKGLKEQTRWMFVAWATILIPIIGLWMRR